MRVFKLLIKILGSAVVFYLPKSFNKIIFGSVDFVFLANLRDYDDLPKATIMEKFLSNLYIKKISCRWPLIVSKIEGIYSKNGKPIMGYVVICPFTAQELIENHKLGFERVLSAARLAEKINAKSINLAAFTSIVTKDGYMLQSELSSKLTTGNTYSAVIAIENVEKAVALIGLNLGQATVAVVGGAGSVGSGCARYLIDKVQKLVLVDLKINELELMKKEISFQNKNLFISNDIKDIREADVIISATNALGRIIKSEFIRKFAIIIDASHPRNVSRKLIKERNDILVIHSAIAKINGLKCDFDFGLGKEEAFGCLAESVILCWLEEFDKDYLGKVRLDLMLELKKYSKEANVEVAPFRNALGYIEESQINNIKKCVVNKYD